MSEVVFREKDHTYWHGTRRVPNVTSILKEVLKPYEHIKSTPEHQENLVYLGKLGKAVHAAAEYELLGCLDYETLKPPVSDFHDATRKAIERLKLRAICVEKMVYSLRLGFVGTMDLRAQCEILSKEYFCTLDWKTSRSYWDHYRIQKAFYLIGWYETFVEHTEAMGVKEYDVEGEKIWLPKNIEKEALICVMLKGDGTFQSKIFTGAEIFKSVIDAIEVLHKYHYENGGW